MDPNRAAVVLLVAGLAAAPALAAPAASPRPKRAELEGLQAAVEAAVARVSRPAGLMFGRPSRAYHLKGYGAVVVLAPRALPRVRRPSATGPEARAFADLLARIERSVEEVADPAERRRLEEALVALRNEHSPGRAIRAPRPLRDPPRDPHSMQAEAEAFRREAERAMERAERDVLIRLRVPGEPELEIAAPPVPLAPAIPPGPPLPMEAPVPPVPRIAAVPPPPAPGAPMTPGWPFWFGEEQEDDAGPPDRVLADVRRAILAGLGAHRGGLAMLGADEFVVVAVDFVPRMSDRAATRTIVARALQRDLVDHHAGRLTAEALRARVEFDDY